MGGIIKGGIYEHFKGNRYHVLGIAHNSETREDMVVYRALYGEAEVWVRPLWMFTETIERDGKKLQRFSYTGETNEKGTLD